MKILEVDQFTSTGSGIEGTKFQDWEADKNAMLQTIQGGDSEAAKVIFGGSVYILERHEDDRPDKGCVWFKPDENGLLRHWKANYDSSG